MKSAEDWATQLAASLSSQFSRLASGSGIELCSIDTEGPEVVEVICRGSIHDGLTGVRVDKAVVESSTGRLSSISIEELAFNLVALAVLEPRPLNEYTSPDNNGVRWLPARRWLFDE